MSDWLDRLQQIGEDEPKKPLAPRVKSAVPKIESVIDFMSSPPATFTQEVYDEWNIKFVLIFEDAEHLCYLATRDNKDGQINEATTVQIFKSESSETLRSLLRQFNIEVIDPVIINHAAFFCEDIRSCEIEMWAAKALKQFCGFRFF